MTMEKKDVISKKEILVVNIITVVRGGIDLKVVIKEITKKRTIKKSNKLKTMISSSFN